jgi:drug/metabolite transporter (DMT)-like permease
VTLLPFLFPPVSAVPPTISRPRAISAIDVLLLVMTVIWGTNYSIVKTAFVEMDAQAFNAIRMAIASAVFLAIIAGVRMRGWHSGPSGRLRSIVVTPEPITRADWISLAGLGVVGHFFYQYFFIGGLARTTVANSSLMLAATPVVIALISAAMGRERIGRLHWFGAALSLAGIYIVIGQGFSLEGTTLTGDLMMFTAVCCWAVYTLGARELIQRHSPVGVTGLSMAIGTVIYVPVMLPNLLRTDWGSISTATWIALVYSALFALCLAYTIWYIAVREIGSARTSVYSNLVPIVAMMTAVVFLDERLTGPRLMGAAAVLIGVALTRVGKTAPIVPPEK